MGIPLLSNTFTSDSGSHHDDDDGGGDDDDGGDDDGDGGDDDDGGGGGDDDDDGDGDNNAAAAADDDDDDGGNDDDVVIRDGLFWHNNHTSLYITFYATNSQYLTIIDVFFNGHYYTKLDHSEAIKLIPISIYRKGPPLIGELDSREPSIGQSRLKAANHLP